MLFYICLDFATAIAGCDTAKAPLEVPRQPDEGRCILELGLMASAEPEPDDRAVCLFADVLELEGGRLLLNGDHDRRP